MHDYSEFDRDPLTAIEAITTAQMLAFAPTAFHATLVMRDRGVLDALAQCPRKAGLSLEAIAEKCGLSNYAARVLLEAGLGLKLIWRKNGQYHLGKLGHFVLKDEMTRTNFDFSRDICYSAAAHMDEALVNGKPAGLKTLGPWETLYQGLSALPEPAQGSWHNFDHFYSDQAFPAMIQKLAEEKPKSLLDIGCNTGRWAHAALTCLPNLAIGLVDLPPQLEKAMHNLAPLNPETQPSCYSIDILDSQAPLPTGYEIIWMSQFLDCFSEQEIINILSRVKSAMGPDTKVWILELFWDRQRFEAAALSLQQTSLYFTCVANGNSQMYESEIFFKLIAEAGLTVSSVTDNVGQYHTLIECTLTEPS